MNVLCDITGCYSFHSQRTQLVCEISDEIELVWMATNFGTVIFLRKYVSNNGIHVTSLCSQIKREILTIFVPLVPSLPLSLTLSQPNKQPHEFTQIQNLFLFFWFAVNSVKSLWKNNLYLLLLS